MDTLAVRLERLLSTRWFPLVINLVVLVILTWTLANWTWRVLTPAAPPTPIAPRSSTQTATFDLPTLLNAQLFGASPAVSGPANVEAIPLSSLNLVLTGVVSAGKNSLALIRADNQPEAPFAVGQEILSGVVLDRVYADRVVIVRGGVAESLLLEGTENTPTAPASNPSPVSRAPTPSANSIVRQQSPNSYVVRRQGLNEKMRQPQDLLRQSLMVPNAGGGFLVREIQAGSLYEKLGLRVGDVIRSANGQPINTLEDAVKLYQQSGSLGSVNLEVVRNGRPENLQYTLQ
jgi:general secretion pathway protein C